MVTEIKLLPCPFCGGEAETFEASEDSFSILCTGCGVETPYLPYLTEAIAAWNRRAEDERYKNALKEIINLACESVEREKTLAKLEAEVMALEPKCGEWVKKSSEEAETLALDWLRQPAKEEHYED